MTGQVEEGVHVLIGLRDQQATRPWQVVPAVEVGTARSQIHGRLPGRGREDGREQGAGAGFPGPAGHRHYLAEHSGVPAERLVAAQDWQPAAAGRGEFRVPGQHGIGEHDGCRAGDTCAGSWPPLTGMPSWPR